MVVVGRSSPALEKVNGEEGEGRRCARLGGKERNESEEQSGNVEARRGGGRGGGGGNPPNPNSKGRGGERNFNDPYQQQRGEDTLRDVFSLLDDLLGAQENVRGESPEG